MNESERNFVRALITLAARIKNLRYEVPESDVDHLKFEVEACHQEMERLNRYAEEQAIDLNKFHRELDEIIESLMTIERGIEAREESLAERGNANIWQQIRNKITWILNLLWSWIMNAGRVLVQRTIRLLAETALAQLPPPSDEHDS